MQHPQDISVPVNVDETVSARIALDEVESALVRAAVGYWRELCRGRPFPARADILPRDIRGLLRNIALLKVVDDGADYDYRIVGDAHVMAYGFSMQGKRLTEMDEFAAGHGEVLKRLYDRVVRKGEPYALRGWIGRSERQKKFIYSESLFAPLGDGETVDHVFNVSVYVPRDIAG
jgi:hypothetical protein